MKKSINALKMRAGGGGEVSEDNNNFDKTLIFKKTNPLNPINLVR